MTTSPSQLGSYVLIDNGMLDEAKRYTEVSPEARPAWLIPIYTEKALIVSPMLIDIGAAHETGELDRAMELVNALKPALHVSLLNTQLSHAELAQHLRQFIFVVTEDGRQHTLRFADCAVLESLSTILTMEQWATILTPLDRWCVHDRTGSIRPLARSAIVQEACAAPFHFSNEQVDALAVATEPDHFIAKVNAMRHGRALPGSAQEQHDWATAARGAWQAAGCKDKVMLTYLTEAAIETRGEVLRRPKLPPILAQVDLASFKSGLREIVQDIEARHRRVNAMALNRPESHV